MKLTIAKLVLMYQRFNKKYFNDELPMVDIKIGKMKALGTTKSARNLLGEMTPKEIKISDRFEWTIEKLENTMLHEMIHVWQAIETNDMNHGKSFKIRAMIIGNQHGTEISRLTDNISFKKTEKSYYVMLNHITGRFLILSTKKNVEEIIKYIQKPIPLYTRLYKSKESFLEKYRTSRKIQAKYYYSNKDIVREIVNNSIRIY